MTTSTTHRPAYQRPELSVHERVDDLLSRMTPAEKIGQMTQLPVYSDPDPIMDSIPLGSILHCDHDLIDHCIDHALHTRLSIPLLVADDCIHGHSFWHGATIFPTQLAQACTWNPSLIKKGARATACEVASTGIHWTFSPVLCVARDTRWGARRRNFRRGPPAYRRDGPSHERRLPRLWPRGPQCDPGLRQTLHRLLPSPRRSGRL
ncbi:glycoside hydrolase family 3 N-terminal domain-containing protein [Cutibacterium acnes]